MTAFKDVVDAFAQKEVNWKDFMEREAQVFAELKVGGIAKDNKERNPWVAVGSTVPITELFSIFAKNPILHRVPVTNAEGDIVGFISQSTIIQWLHKNAKEAIPDRKVEDSDLKAKIISVKNSYKVLDAFNVLLEAGIHGAPVVDDNGVLVGSLSCSAIKKIEEKALFKHLQIPVSEFLKTITPKSLKPITCTPATSLTEVISLLATHKVHRIFVVDKDNHVTRVVSLSDVIRATT